MEPNIDKEPQSRERQGEQGGSIQGILRFLARAKYAMARIAGRPVQRVRAETIGVAEIGASALEDLSALLKARVAIVSEDHCFVRGVDGR